MNARRKLNKNEGNGKLKTHESPEHFRNDKDENGNTHARTHTNTHTHTGLREEVQSGDHGQALT